MNQRSIGGLWQRMSKSNQTYFTGQIEQTNGARLDIVIFANDKGDNPKRPDYRIFLSEPRGEQHQGQQRRGEAPSGNATANAHNDFVDDIPF